MSHWMCKNEMVRRERMKKRQQQQHRREVVGMNGANDENQQESNECNACFAYFFFICIFCFERGAFCVVVTVVYFCLISALKMKKRSYIRSHSGARTLVVWFSYTLRMSRSIDVIKKLRLLIISLSWYALKKYSYLSYI